MHKFQFYKWLFHFINKMLKNIIDEVPKFNSEEEAKQKAHEDLKALFYSKYVFQNIETLEDEIRLMKEQVCQQDIIAVQKEVKGIEDIHSIALASKKEVGGISETLSGIQKQWKEATRSEFAAHSDQISQLILCTRNIDLLISQIDTHTNMNSEIIALREKLADHDNILEVYKKLKVFGFVYLKLVEKLEKDKRVSEISSVDKAFEDYHMFKQEFYNTLFELIRNSIIISSSKPALLVKLVQIIEYDDKYNQALNNKFEKVLCL